MKRRLTRVQRYEALLPLGRRCPGPGASDVTLPPPRENRDAPRLNRRGIAVRITPGACYRRRATLAPRGR
jgi:hypothetical protein